MKRLTDDLTVSPQIPLDAIPAIAEAGFKTIMCNRPDNEDPGQPSFEEIKAKAAECGLGAVHLPVASGSVEDSDADAFAKALADLPGPVFAYCRSGTRCTILWALANADKMPVNDIVTTAANAGYDVSGLAPRLASRA